MTRASVAGDFDYETTGHAYAFHRRPDQAIEAHVHAALGNAASVLNVGAGSGSYEPADRYVVAVEPSAVMRSQRPVARPAIDAVAEALPFDDDSFDAAMAIITVHQWSDLAAGLAELRRVSRGPVVVLTFDGPVLDDFWLCRDYVPELAAAEQARQPPVEGLLAALGPRSRSAVVPIPLACTDGFVEAFYGRPERLLDPAVRAAQSSWGFTDEAAIRRGLTRLRADLDSGAWDERHGALRTQTAYEGALRLVVGEAS